MVDILDDDFLLVPVRQAGGSMQTVNTTQKSASPEDESGTLAAKALKKSGWREQRDNMRSRALDILIGHFSEKKSSVETRALLMQPFEKGGASVTPADADMFVEAIASVASGQLGDVSAITKPAMQSVAAPAVTPVKKDIPQTPPPVPEKTATKQTDLPVRAAPSEVQVVKPAPLPATTNLSASVSRVSSSPTKALGDTSSKTSAVRSELSSTKVSGSTSSKTSQPMSVASQSKTSLSTKALGDTPVKSPQQVSVLNKMQPVPVAKAPVVPVPPLAQSTSAQKQQVEKVVVKAQPSVAASSTTPMRTLPASREEAIVMLTNEITQALAFKLPDQYSQDRLRYIISARLREIRDWGETEEALEKPITAGGLGLSRLDIEKVRVELEERVKEIEAMVAEKQKTDVRVALQIETKTAQTKKDVKKQEDSKEVEAVYKQVLSGGLRNAASSAKASAPAPLQPIAPSAPKTMTDIRPPQSALVGPVEEIRRMTLGDFRKLSSDPKEAVHKIQDKFALIEQQSFLQKLAGVHALKESEVYTLYYTMVRASVMKGVSITEVIHDRSGEGLPVLTEAEFSAIMELSRILRV